MTDHQHYIELNRANWDDRAAAHAASPDYQFDAFVADPTHLSKVVQFDRPRLGEITGLRGVHLQCHIGTDTLSLARLGASMTGLDFSVPALEQARRLSKLAGPHVDYVHAAVDDAADVLPKGAFDLVYTGVGALCWLPSVERWAAIVARLLCPGGRLFIREGHPMLWSLDENHTDGLVVGYPYFEQAEPLVDEGPGTYVTTDQVFTHNTAASWNHGLGEVITALHHNGMQLEELVEHDSVPWDALPGQMVVDDRGEWRLIDQPWRLAASYTLRAVKTAR
jgi:SAM-dependent methyltransferase